MKKISILLSVMLLAFAVSCSSPNKPEETTDTSNYITLAEREGNYEGDMGTTKLTIVFDNKGQVTEIMVGTLDFSTMGVLPTKVGDPTSTNTEYIFDVQMKDGDKPSGKVTKVKVIFDSDTEATGGKAYFGVNAEPNMDNPIIIKKVS